MREVETCARMLTSVQHRLLVEAGERSLPARAGVKSLKMFLMQTLRLAGADAGARVHQASWLAAVLTRIHLREEQARRGHRRRLRSHAPPAPTAA